jgi:hypothetical protein
VAKRDGVIIVNPARNDTARRLKMASLDTKARDHKRAELSTFLTTGQGSGTSADHQRQLRQGGGPDIDERKDYEKRCKARAQLRKSHDIILTQIFSEIDRIVGADF